MFDSRGTLSKIDRMYKVVQMHELLHKGPPLQDFIYLSAVMEGPAWDPRETHDYTTDISLGYRLQCVFDLGSKSQLRISYTLIYVLDH